MLMSLLREYKSGHQYKTKVKEVKGNQSKILIKPVQSQEKAELKALKGLKEYKQAEETINNLFGPEQPYTSPKLEGDNVFSNKYFTQLL